MHTSRVRLWGVIALAVFCVYLALPHSARAQGESTLSDPLKKQNILTLYKDGTLAVDTHGKATLSTLSSETGIVVSGSPKDIAATDFALTKIIDFGTTAPSRVAIDALASRRAKTAIEIYVDGAKTPLATLRLANQKRENKWSNTAVKVADLSFANLQGRHTVTFKFVPSVKGSQAVFFRGFTFMHTSIPLISFSLDESLGSIDAMNSDPAHAAECYGDVNIAVPQGYVSEYGSITSQNATYALDYVRGRGNSTWDADKKPYKMKLDKAADLLGMGKNKHWVLLANRYDNSFLRNKITYWLGEKFGLAYTPKIVPVDVVMNGRYLGTYDLAQQVRVGKSRVEIDDLEDDPLVSTEPTITGGYLLSMSNGFDGQKDEDGKYSFATKHSNGFLIESPSFENENQSLKQRDYIRGYFQKLEDAIYGKNFKASNGASYKDYVDVTSMAKYYWIQEISKNGDGFGSGSTYLYKPRGGKLFWGPLWDFDFVAWGDMDYAAKMSVDEFTHNDKIWFPRLMQDSSYVNVLKSQWPDLRALLMQASKQGGQIDKYAQQIRESAQYDRDTWGAYLEDYGDDNTSQAGKLTFDQEVMRLKTWTAQRSAWVDRNLSKIRPGAYKITFKNGKKTVATYTYYQNTGIDGWPKALHKKGYTFKGWYKKSARR